MVGIISYGAYIPKYRIKSEEIARVHNSNVFIRKELLVEEKSVPGFDEDSLTMAVEASLNALKRKDINKTEIGAIYSGSETPVYAVKPNASIIGEALGIGHNYTAADVEFACKAGTAALQMVIGLTKSGFIRYGMAVGCDAPPVKPGDIVEHTTAAGAASFIVGNNEEEIIAELEEMHSVSSDTPDFWRRPTKLFGHHTERFTWEPSYLKHTIMCTKILMEKANVTVDDIDHVGFHTPNAKYPLKAGEVLGFTKKKLESNLIVSKIGNTYAVPSLLVLTHILDKAKPGERVVITSYGSGAGSDSFLFKITQNIKKLKRVKTTQEYINDKEYINYTKYCKFTEMI